VALLPLLDQAFDLAWIELINCARNEDFIDQREPLPLLFRDMQEAASRRRQTLERFGRGNLGPVTVRLRHKLQELTVILGCASTVTG
jgi:hypothetical protein